MSKLECPEFDKSETSVQLPKGIKENTLKAKLLELDRKARNLGQKCLNTLNQGMGDVDMPEITRFFRKNLLYACLSGQDLVHF